MNENCETCGRYGAVATLVTVDHRSGQSTLSLCKRCRPAQPNGLLPARLASFRELSKKLETATGEKRAQALKWWRFFEKELGRTVTEQEIGR